VLAAGSWRRSSGRGHHDADHAGAGVSADHRARGCQVDLAGSGHDLGQAPGKRGPAPRVGQVLDGQVSRPASGELDGKLLKPQDGR
jgi:hypothetical protein